MSTVVELEAISLDSHGFIRLASIKFPLKGRSKKLRKAILSLLAQGKLYRKDLLRFVIEQVGSGRRYRKQLQRLDGVLDSLRQKGVIKTYHRAERWAHYALNRDSLTFFPGKRLAEWRMDPSPQAVSLGVGQYSVLETLFNERWVALDDNQNQWAVALASSDIQALGEQRESLREEYCYVPFLDRLLDQLIQTLTAHGEGLLIFEDPPLE
jgi:hypothetical protein